MASEATLPATMRGVVLRAPGDLAVQELPVPEARQGTAVVRVLHAMVPPSTAAVAGRASHGFEFTLPAPLVIGGVAVGRVAAVGPDAVSLAPGQLVLVDPFLRARDDPGVAALLGLFDGVTAAAKRLVRDNWRDGCFAEYVRVPLENALALDEARLCGRLGLATRDLVYLGPLAIAYAGLSSVGFQAGETVVVAPATGLFSGAAVHAARAMGARVIAASRSAEGLQRLRDRFPDLATVQLRGDAEDTNQLLARGPVDVFVDVSPPAATGSAHLGACMRAVRPYGRVCLLGATGDQALPYPYALAIFNSLTIRGSWMYSREQLRNVSRLAESGALRLGPDAGLEILGSYPLEEFEAAIEHGKQGSAGRVVILNP